MIQSAFLAAHAYVRGLEELRGVIARSLILLLLLLGRHLPRFIRQERGGEAQLGRQLARRDRLTQPLRQGDDDALQRAHNPPYDEARDLTVSYRYRSFFSESRTTMDLVSSTESRCRPEHRSTTTDRLFSA